MRAGLTISSALIVEGEPPRAFGLVGDLTDLLIAICRSKRFIVHVIDETQTAIADDFAGRRPGPDALFGTLGVTDTEWGPEIAALPTRAYCTFTGFIEIGYSLLVTGTNDQIDIAATDRSPLVHYRGRYDNLRTR